MEGNQIILMLGEYAGKARDFVKPIFNKYQSYIYTAGASLALGVILTRGCSNSPVAPKIEDPLRPIPVRLRLQDLDKDGYEDGIVNMSNDSENYIFMGMPNHQFISLLELEKQKRVLTDAKIIVDRSKLEEELKNNHDNLEGKIKP